MIPITDEAVYIVHETALRRWCADVGEVTWLALDTEFVRERTYYPHLCLIQVASEHHIACVDALQIADLKPLLELLWHPRIVKVLHAGQQDLEIFFNRYHQVPRPIFDTQLAAILLGGEPQIGYATLVEAVLGIALDKSQTRTDWHKRPLTAAQLAYAADDVRYLRDLYRHQRQALQQLGRSDWLQDDFAALCDPDHYRPKPLQMWQRIKEHSRLKGVQLAVLQAVAAWREQCAQQLNWPRQWLIRDKKLLLLAKKRPRTVEQLAAVGLEAAFLKAYGEALLAVINAACKSPPSTWPQPVASPVLTAQQEALVDMLMAWVRQRAVEERIKPTLLASRRDLERWVANPVDSPLLRGWRAHVIGRQLQALLNGQASIRIEADQVVMEPVTIQRG